MLIFSSLDLQKRTGDIQCAALREPVAVTFHGRPRSIMLSVEEFCRLKSAAKEPIPAELRRRSEVLGPTEDDPLAYDTENPVEAVVLMARDAIAGRNQDAVRREAGSVARALSHEIEMTPRSLNDDGLRPVFLIMDNSPIVMLSAIGKLDWLLEPCGTVYMTDMIMEEATREPESDNDPRRKWLDYTRSWLERFRFRIRRVDTEHYSQYQLAVEGWKSTGADPARRPKLRNLGEASVREALTSFRGKLRPEETIIVLMDDADGRDMLRGIRRINLDICGTRTFIELLSERFGIAEAVTAWQAVVAIIPSADPGEEPDPVYVRRGTP